MQIPFFPVISELKSKTFLITGLNQRITQWLSNQLKWDFKHKNYSIVLSI